MCRIVVNHHGALRIEGEFTLVDPEGRVIDTRGRRSVALCRCGASRQKPFCDGSHNTTHFRSVVSGTEPEDDAGGQTPTANGS